MRKKEDIVSIIYAVIDEINKRVPKENRLSKSLDTVLVGKTGKLDSLGIVGLITAIEQKIQDKLDLPISLVDERALSQNNSPFENVDSLAEYILLLLK